MIMLCGCRSGDTTAASPKTTPNYTSETPSPLTSGDKEIKSQNHPKNQNFLQNANPHGSEFTWAKCSPSAETTLSWIPGGLLAPLCAQVQPSRGHVSLPAAMLAPLWGQLRPSWAYDHAIWAPFGGYYGGVTRNNPKLYLGNALPSGPRGEERK